MSNQMRRPFKELISKNRGALEHLFILRNKILRNQKLRKVYFQEIMNSKNRNDSSRSNGSDDGYNSDLEIKKEEIIKRDNIDFRRKYQVEQLLNNSANGVIYTGKHTVNLKAL